MNHRYSCAAVLAGVLMACNSTTALASLSGEGPATVEATAEPAALSVIRSTYRHEITQERKTFAMKNLWASVMLSEIYRVDSNRLERRYPQPAFVREPKAGQKIRGAELKPGAYRVGLSCVHQTGSSFMWEDFVITIDAAPGREYVLECLGTLGAQRDIRVEVTDHPLTAIAPGVVREGEDCMEFFDIPWLASMRAEKCRSKYPENANEPVAAPVATD
jgi:hypothetical protein